jgi:hypothetical protein
MPDAGIDCVGFEAGGDATPRVADAKALVEGRGTCSIEGERVLVATFENSADRADGVAVGGLLGPVAVGPNWVATSRSEKVVAHIVEALDATQHAEAGS